jgi:hypothetical protein
VRICFAQAQNAAEDGAHDLAELTKAEFIEAIARIAYKKYAKVGTAVCKNYGWYCSVQELWLVLQYARTMVGTAVCKNYGWYCSVQELQYARTMRRLNCTHYRCTTECVLLSTCTLHSMHAPPFPFADKCLLHSLRSTLPSQRRSVRAPSPCAVC